LRCAQRNGPLSGRTRDFLRLQSCCRIARMANRYILFFKPYDVLSTFTDPEGRQTLGSYVTAPGVYAAGRLDQDSEGLMLLTDDGRLAHVLTNPDHKLPKTYFVQVENEPDKAAISQLRRGVLIKGEMTLPAEVDLLDEAPDLPPRSVPIRYRPSIPTRWLRIVLREGRKRQIRHMTAAVGHPTLRLVRVAIGPLTLRGLQPGEWRDLTSQELEALRHALGLTQTGGRVVANSAATRTAGPRTPVAGRRPPAGGARAPRQEPQRGRGGDERDSRPERGVPARSTPAGGAGRRADWDRPPRRAEPEQETPRRTGRSPDAGAHPAGPRAGRGPQPPRSDDSSTAQRGGKRTGPRPPAGQGPRTGAERPETRGPKPARQQDRRPEPRRDERPEPPPRERRPKSDTGDRTRARPPGGASRSIGQRPKRRPAQ
jgi:23S rRNA pseudouridine2457 synthase